MPRRKQPATVVRRSAPADRVRAVQNMSKGGRFIPAGTWLPRDDEVVVERPDLFEVVYRLSAELEEVNYAETEQ
jgi:hypothetical protein